jgi:hypothetical protein
VPADSDDARIRDAWADFCAALRQLGDQVLSEVPSGDELDCAEGIRYLSRLVRSAFDQVFESASPDAPRIEPMYSPRTSVAQRNPDQIYLRANVTSRHDYRLIGRRGTGGVLSFATRAGRQGSPEEGLTGYLDDSDLAIAPDGSFEVLVSALPQHANWLPMSSATDLLMVRELFDDPEGAVPSVLSIERMDGQLEEVTLTIDATRQALAQAAASVRGLLGRFGGWTSRCTTQPNRLWTMDELLGEGGILQVGGSPGIDYNIGYWEIGADQALVIETAPEPGDRWSFQLMNHWQENLNLPWSASHLNHATAQLGPDRSLRLVVAVQDPGVENWIETAEHSHGVMLFRWFGETHDRPQPTIRVVPLSELEPNRSQEHVRRSRQVAPGYLGPRIG